jgi:hypothetical protein
VQRLVWDEQTKSDDDFKVNRSAGQTEKYLNPVYGVINIRYINVPTRPLLPKATKRKNARPKPGVVVKLNLLIA